jgi:hypothetical protein
MAGNVRHVQRDSAGGNGTNGTLGESFGGVGRLDSHNLLRTHLATERRIGLRAQARKPHHLSALKRLLAGGR